jgi:hypothetical protein
MEPFARALIGIASNHLAVTDAVAVTVRRLVCVNVAIVFVALHATIRIFIRQLSNGCMNSGTKFLLVLLSSTSSLVVPRRT